MRRKYEHFHNVKELPHDEMLAPGSSLCAGCGALAILRLMHNVLGKRVVVVNAAGCMTLLAVYPLTPLRSSWLYTTMGSAAAGAQGIRDALDVLRRRYRLPAEEDLEVLVLAGDGSTYDMGLSSTSAAIHRNLDFWYLCYDNEAYGNTGFQASSASPYASHTATSTSGLQLAKKDLFEIWRAQRPAYMATVSAHEALDLADKVARAREFQGPKLFLALAVCPTGWGFEPSHADQVARLAVETGAWPLKEAVHGVVRHTLIPSHRRPVEEYLQTQQRFGHLFHPVRREETLRKIQERIDLYWTEVRRCELAAEPALATASDP